MLSKFTIALLLGAVSVEAQYRPYRRTGPSGPTRRYGPSRPIDEGQDDEDYELNLDFEATEGQEDDGKYSARLRGGYSGYTPNPYGSGEGTPEDLSKTWPLEQDPYAASGDSTEGADGAEKKEEEEEKPEGWFSATEQYSPAYIEYEAAPFKTKHIYAICNMMSTDGNDDAGIVRLV